MINMLKYSWMELCQKILLGSLSVGIKMDAVMNFILNIVKTLVGWYYAKILGWSISMHRTSLDQGVNEGNEKGVGKRLTWLLAVSIFSLPVTIFWFLHMVLKA